MVLEWIDSVFLRCYKLTSKGLGEVEGQPFRESTFAVPVSLYHFEGGVIMKRIAIAVCVVVLVLAVTTWAQTPAKPKSVSVEQELLKLEQDWTNADLKADVAFLDRILADDWVITDNDGTVTNKAQDLASLKSGELVLSSMVTDDMKARVYGDAAVVTGRNTLKGTSKGKDISGQERWTDTWIKMAGHWRCVATHSSKIAGK